MAGMSWLLVKDASGPAEWLGSVSYTHLEDVVFAVEIELKYAGYIRKQMRQIERTQRLENMKIPRDTDYSLVHGISREAREKLTAVAPGSIGQAARISGVNPADIVALIAYLEAGGHKQRQSRGVRDGV